MFTKLRKLGSTKGMNGDEEENVDPEMANDEPNVEIESDLTPQTQEESIDGSVDDDNDEGKPNKKSKPNSKFNLMPKFRSNKLEPLNVENDGNGDDNVNVDDTINSGTKKLKVNKKMKRTNKVGKLGKMSSASSNGTLDLTPSSHMIINSEPPANMNQIQGQTPTIQVIEVDAEKLRKTSKVIFAVPQFPGQPMVPIAYKVVDNSHSKMNGVGGDRSRMFNNRPISNRSRFGGDYISLDGRSLIGETHFEVVWRNLIYYHQTTAKKLQKFNEEKTKMESGNTKPGNHNSVPSSSTSLTSRGNKLLTNKNGPQPALNNISGSFCSGQMTAIMGPSGAGKTVFLNCITGKLSINSRKENSGDILVNGTKQIRIGFVEQFDHLLPHLTVRETLIFASRIKNAARYYLNHAKIVDNAINRLDLNDCSEYYASKCSNGQRKRLSIAIELCFNSDILILDEPTTGLDSVTGYQIMKMLKTLTKRKRAIAILATIHQPSPRMFQLFDNLIILSREATIMYQGSPDELPQTLSLVGLSCPMYTNVSDFVLEVASGDYGRQTLHLLSHYGTEYNRTRIAEDINEVDCTSLQEAVKRADQNQNKRSFLLCTWLLLIRTMWCNWRNPFNTQIRICSLILTSIFLGILFTDNVGSVSTCPPTKYFLWRFEMDSIMDETSEQLQKVQENLALLFMVTVVCLFNSMLNIVVTVPVEIAVFRREYDNYSYSILTFYLAKILGDIPFTFTTTSLFAAAVHRTTGQVFDEWFRVWYIVLPCCMITFIGQFVGMTIGIIFSNNLDASVYSIIFIIIPLIMFSGFFRLISEMDWFMAQVSWISFLKQAINSVLISQYGLNRCEYEDRLDYERFLKRNVSEADARPSWINSMTTLIDYQLMLTETNDTNLLEIKNGNLESEEKLVRYMGLNIVSNNKERTTMKQAIVLQHFDLKPDFESYWEQITILSYYIVILAIILYIVMAFKFNRKR